MTFFNALMMLGIKVQPVANLIAPMWQSWMNSTEFPLLTAFVPTALYAAWFMYRTLSNSSVEPVHPVETVAAISSTEDSEIPVPLDTMPATDDDYIQQLEEIFGVDYDDGPETTEG